VPISYLVELHRWPTSQPGRTLTFLSIASRIVLSSVGSSIEPLSQTSSITLTGRRNIPGRNVKSFGHSPNFFLEIVSRTGCERKPRLRLIHSAYGIQRSILRASASCGASGPGPCWIERISWDDGSAVCLARHHDPCVLSKRELTFRIRCDGGGSKYIGKLLPWTIHITSSLKSFSRYNNNTS
jgi:hypothetical protein